MSILDEIKFRFQQNNAITRIIFLNVFVFLFFSVLSVLGFLFNQSIFSDIVSYFVLPSNLSKLIFQPWSILTYMFLHDGFMHILFNMLWLYWIGSLIQEYLGNTKTYEAYFLGGISGGLLYLLAYNLMPVFAANVSYSFALGASAGVLAVVCAAATLLPDYNFQLLFFGNVKLKYIALISVLLDLISIPQGNAGGHIAHLGGALFGYMFIKLIYANNNLSYRLDALFDGILNVFTTKPKIKIQHKTTFMKTASNVRPSQVDVDVILDKISKSGYESLSQAEKETLFKASKD
jgi:membrane associated rhomboid family serine protease